MVRYKQVPTYTFQDPLENFYYNFKNYSQLVFVLGLSINPRVVWITHNQQLVFVLGSPIKPGGFLDTHWNILHPATSSTYIIMHMILQRGMSWRLAKPLGGHASHVPLMARSLIHILFLTRVFQFNNKIIEKHSDRVFPIFWTRRNI